MISISNFLDDWTLLNAIHGFCLLVSIFLLLGINVPPPPPSLISNSIPNKVEHQELEPQKANENPTSPEEQINVDEVVKNLTETVQRAESAGKFDNKKASDISKRIKLFEEKLLPILISFIPK